MQDDAGLCSASEAAMQDVTCKDEYFDVGTADMAVQAGGEAICTRQLRAHISDVSTAVSDGDVEQQLGIISAELVDDDKQQGMQQHVVSKVPPKRWCDLDEVELREAYTYVFATLGKLGMPADVVRTLFERVCEEEALEYPNGADGGELLAWLKRSSRVDTGELAKLMAEAP